MSEWRVKGYVGDSEDEDDLDLGSPPWSKPHEGVEPTAGYTEAKFQACDVQKEHFGISAITDGHQSLDVRPLEEDVDRLFPVSSSPLSEPPSSPILEQDQQHNFSDLPDLWDTLAAARTVEAAEEGRLNNGGRVFRRRNPIQLHPYLLESEHYRQALKARGLKPVNLPTDRRQSPEFSGLDLTQASQELSNPSVPASPVSLASRYDSPPSSPRITSVLDDLDLQNEEFPDLASVFRWPVPGSARQGSKKRRLNERLSTPLPLLRVNHDLTETPTYQHNEVASTQALQSTPPFTSRPQTEKSAKRQRRFKRFKVPRGSTPAALLTPAASSDIAAVDLADEVFSRDAGEDEVVAVDDDTDQSEDPEIRSNERANRELRRAQKRTRGVLPASWARLDVEAQRSAATARLAAQGQNKSPVKGLQQRGVAQRVNHFSATAQTPVAKRNIFEFSSDSESDDEVRADMNNEHQTTLTSSAQILPDSPGKGYDEVVEGNSINLMRPSASGTRTSHRGSKKTRQPRITDGDWDLRVVGLKAVTHRMKPSQSKHQSRNATLSTTRPRLHPRPPSTRRSIVDMVNFANPHPAPNFVRVAVRTARLRADHGRHEPRNKRIALHSVEDTHDIMATLQLWRAGSIELQYPQPPKLHSAYKHRRPLSEANANARQAPLRPSKKPQSRRHTDTSRPQGVRPSRRLVKLPRQSREEDNNNCRREILTNPPPAIAGSGERNGIPYASRTVLRSVNGPNDRKGRSTIRPAQLEELEDFQDNDPHNAFQRQLLQVDRQYEREHAAFKSLPGPLIARLLGQTDDSVDTTHHSEATQASLSQDPISQMFGSAKARGSKRRLVRRDPGTDVFPDNSIVMVDDYTPIMRQDVSFSYADLPLDLSLLRLPLDTCFHESSFLGSLTFESILSIRQREFDLPTKAAVVCIDNESYHWGTWNQEISAKLGDIFDWFKTQCEDITRPHNEIELIDQKDQIVDAMISLATFISKGLSFSDSIDRRHFVERMNRLLSRLRRDMTSFAVDRQDKPSMWQSRALLRLQMLLAVLFWQLRVVAAHTTVPTSLRDEVHSGSQTAFSLLLKTLLEERFNDLAETLEDTKGPCSLDPKVHDKHTSAEILVVVSQLLEEGDVPLPFWRLVGEHLESTRLQHNSDLVSIEEAWQRILTILPFQDFSREGLITMAKTSSPSGIWLLIKSLLSKSLESSYSSVQGSTNVKDSLIRAWFSRCYKLVNFWDRTECESILYVMFDFLARGGLQPLYGKEGRGSPNFLRCLDERVRPTLTHGDPSFHIFLKTLSCGMFSIENSYSPGKIRSIAWRFIPNSGRVYRKDEDLKQSDLDALRNHYDLLCVLYWVSPTGYRPNLNLLRNLVNLGSSHLELCRLSVRAWANLARFQISIEETLDEFSLWYGEILKTFIAQHRLARVEAESVYNASETRISIDLLHSVVDRNERSIEAIMETSLDLFKEMLMTTKALVAATELLRNAAISEVFSTFDQARPRLQRSIIIALEIYQAYINIASHSSGDATNQQSEESQEYGDWPDLIDIQTDLGELQPVHPFDQPMVNDVFRLLSNAFGADDPPEDKFLAKLVETWVAVVLPSMRAGTREWSQILDPHGQLSWSRLRDTDQTCAYEPYLQTTLLNSVKDVFIDRSFYFLSSWLNSLVEREAKLKHQHLLTSALLNHGSKHPLLTNLPFSRRRNSEKYEISLEEIRQRRINLISSILANMRDYVFNYELALDSTQNPRQEFAALIKSMMATMKRNFLSVHNDAQRPDSYVLFVHSVVEFLQQYTTEICQIDKFFTASTTFPLPAEDPHYIASRLKSYGVDRVEPKNQKKLAIFVQTTTERAVVSGLQALLIQQIQKSATSSFEHSDTTHPSLRRILLEAIAPSYLEEAAKWEHGWLLAIPLLETSQQLLAELLYSFSVTDHGSVGSAISIVNTLSHSLQQAAIWTASSPPRSNHSHTLALLRAMAKVMISTLALTDYLSRSGFEMTETLDVLSFFEEVALTIISGDCNFEGIATTIKALPPPSLARRYNFPELRAFCAKELRDAKQSWIYDGEKYWFNRGAHRRNVPIDTQSTEDEAQLLQGVMTEFLNKVGRLFHGQAEQSHASRALTASDPIFI